MKSLSVGGFALSTTVTQTPWLPEKRFYKQLVEFETSYQAGQSAKQRKPLFCFFIFLSIPPEYGTLRASTILEHGFAAVDLASIMPLSCPVKPVAHGAITRDFSYDVASATKQQQQNNNNRRLQPQWSLRPRDFSVRLAQL